MPNSRALVTSPAFRVMNIPRRAASSFAAQVGPMLVNWARWLLASREDTNHTYDVTGVNEVNMAASLAAVLDIPVSKVEAAFEELKGDDVLRAHIAEATRRSHRRGLGSVVICAALLRNHFEGRPGRYIGTEINPRAGDLLGGRYAEVGRIVYDDSLNTLRALGEEIGLFINDSDHSATYEAAEYEVVGPKMAEGGFMIGDNAHATTALAAYARARGRPFFFIAEQPMRHWHPGSGAGLVRFDAAGSAHD